MFLFFFCPPFSLLSHRFTAFVILLLQTTKFFGYCYYLSNRIHMDRQEDERSDRQPYSHSSQQRIEHKYSNLIPFCHNNGKNVFLCVCVFVFIFSILLSLFIVAISSSEHGLSIRFKTIFLWKSRRKCNNEQTTTTIASLRGWITNSTCNYLENVHFSHTLIRGGLVDKTCAGEGGGGRWWWNNKNIKRQTKEIYSYWMYSYENIQFLVLFVDGNLYTANRARERGT